MNPDFVLFCGFTMNLLVVLTEGYWAKVPKTFQAGGESGRIDWIQRG